MTADRCNFVPGGGFFTVNLAERKLTLLPGYLGPKESGDREEMGFARAQPILRAVTVFAQVAVVIALSFLFG